MCQPTKTLLKNLKDVAVIEVYLKGTFPAGFQRLSEATRDVLQEFKEVGGNKIRFEFINPMEGKDEKGKNAVYTQLAEKGINPVNLKVQGDEEEGYSEKLFFLLQVFRTTTKKLRLVYWKDILVCRHKKD